MSVCVRSTQYNCIGEIVGRGGNEGRAARKKMQRQYSPNLADHCRTDNCFFLDHDDRLSHFRNIVVGTLQPVSSTGDLSGQFYLSIVLF